MLPALRPLKDRRRVRYREPQARKPPPGYKCTRDGLVSHRKDHVRPAQQEIYERNARESPLLRLPSEIRQRISELVLGNRYIRIISRYDAVQKKPVFSTTVKELCESGHLSREFQSFSVPGTIDAPLRLTLLPRVCRQFHQETTLLLYELNMFAFFDYGHMRKFLRCIRVVHARVIRKMFVKLVDRQSTKADRKKLTGMREFFFVHPETGQVVCTGSRIGKC